MDILHPRHIHMGKGRLQLIEPEASELYMMKIRQLKRLICFRCFTSLCHFAEHLDIFIP